MSKRAVLKDEDRARAVRAYIAGDTVVMIARRFAVSRAAVYNWIAEAKGYAPRKNFADRIASLEARVTALELIEGKSLCQK